MTSPSRVLLALAFLASTGCPSDAQPPARRVAEVADDTPRFDVDVDAPARATAGRPSHARVKVSARTPWHMNLEYPATLRVEPPRGVEMQAAAQPERFDSDSAEFAVPFTARAGGPAHFQGQLQFAVCADEACAPATVPLDFTVDVGCDTDAFC